jgi:hypothetical protein
MALALHWAVNHFKGYLQFVHFEVYMGAVADGMFLKRAHFTPSVQGMLIDLFCYDFDILPAKKAFMPQLSIP